jgi:hypothetical protein
MKIDSGQMTQLLRAMANGDSSAAETLLVLVYTECTALRKAT